MTHRHLPPTEGLRLQMLAELRTLLGVLDRKLIRLHEAGSRELVARAADLRMRTAEFIAQLEQQAPSPERG